MPADLFHCAHCERLFDAAGIGDAVHREIQAGYPPEILEQAGRLAAWLDELSLRYRERLHIRVIDPQSLQGFFKSLRHWVRRYPAFIVGHLKYVGWERAALDGLLEEQMAQHASPERIQE
jgi:hypothetical protein